MDVAAACDVPVNLGSVATNSAFEEEKRDGGDDGGKESAVEAAPPPSKKPRFDEEVNRVAEIVLVLSSLRRIRGGKIPTELELELMVEAKSKLVDMCQEFTPKDIIGRDAIGAVIEDLGLNCKLKDQRLGFRAPKLTISEKLSLGKRKMEESKKHPIVSTTYTPPSHSISTNNVSMANHQWPNSEMKASTSSVNASGSHFVRDASSVTQSRPPFKSDMHPVASHVPVPGGNYFGNATSWSAQPHSSSSTTISFGTASESKAPVQSSSRVTDPSFRPFISQTPQGTFPGMKGVTYGGQTSSPFGNNNHAEIAKIIHKVLQPRAKQNVSWKPPSREYMSKAMTCQMCQGAINEVETVLICDACEKGYHLKCLQLNNMKGVPKSEWHCPRCVQLYNGKSFPPKYGRVMRSSTTTAKMSSSNPEVQLPPEKKVGKVVLKVGGSQEPVSHSGTAKPPQGAPAAINQTIEAEDAAAAAAKSQIEGEDAEAPAKSQTIQGEYVAVKSQTVEGEDAAAAKSQTVEAEDAAAGKSQTVEAEDAGATSQPVKSEDESAKSQTVQAEDAAGKSQTVQAEDAVAKSQTVEGEDADRNQAVDASNSESQGLIGNDAECDDPLKLENKDASERSVSADCQEKEDSKIVAEPSLQEENSVSQTENLPSQPSSEPNTDHSQQQNTTPNVEVAIQKNVREDSLEDKSCRNG